MNEERDAGREREVGAQCISEHINFDVNQGKFFFSRIITVTINFSNKYSKCKKLLWQKLPWLLRKVYKKVESGQVI